ncbi:unnamed protein product [Protopolystoma xenopodis]|uniref:Uncharacterized protein n=1 Tax=Protopolystoma xenopodis TaxID=117903 RepID=A0A3S5FED1_9PLAT|nr:unnamed protein product [Protopolystoma xenopodis]
MPSDVLLTSAGGGTLKEIHRHPVGRPLPGYSEQSYSLNPNSEEENSNQSHPAVTHALAQGHLLLMDQLQSVHVRNGIPGSQTAGSTSTTSSSSSRRHVPIGVSPSHQHCQYQQPHPQMTAVAVSGTYGQAYTHSAHSLQSASTIGQAAEVGAALTTAGIGMISGANSTIGSGLRVNTVENTLNRETQLLNVRVGRTKQAGQAARDRPAGLASNKSVPVDRLTVDREEEDPGNVHITLLMINIFFKALMKFI